MTFPTAPLGRVALLLLLAGCAARTKDLANAQDAALVDELPKWATDRLSVKRELARDLIEQGNTRLALDVIRDLRQSDGIDAPELDLLQGIALRDEGLHAEADRLLDAARHAMPRNAEVHEALCVLRADQKQVEAALASCTRATELDPDRASAWNNLGFLRMSSGDLAGALQALERAVDIDAVEVRYRNNLGLAQAANGRAQDALRTFMSTGSRALAHYNVGAALERFGQASEALAHYGRALEYDPELSTARTAIARLGTPNDPDLSGDGP